MLYQYLLVSSNEITKGGVSLIRINMKNSPSCIIDSFSMQANFLVS